MREKLHKDEHSVSDDLDTSSSGEKGQCRATTSGVWRDGGGHWMRAPAELQPGRGEAPPQFA
jgi:hypothetical protein